ncbi:MAG: winged helix-turn-helix domain-containing protein [Candidatus Thorarchaeota archaeon]
MKNIIIFYFKRLIHYLIVIQGIMTILFLILFFQNVITLNIIHFYLYFSIVVFIVYGFSFLTIHFLEKPHIATHIPKPEKIIEAEKEVKLEIFEEILQGKTLQVYWYFFTHKHAGVREIQKALNISSSGTVSYQITKLLNAGIISRDEEEGKYSLNEMIKIGVIKFFVRIGKRTIPRISLYLFLYFFGFVMYFILFLIDTANFILTPFSLLLLIFLIVGTIIFTIESLKIRKLKPT